MILTQTPYRVSLFGGGTDYPEWYKENGGLVVGMAINKYAYIGVNWAPPGQTHKYRVTYSKIENWDNLEAIGHPGARGVLKHLNVQKPITVSYMGDLPAGSGLGASSAYVVGLLKAVRELLGVRMADIFAAAEEAIYIERHVIGEAVGDQDQMFAVHGGLRTFKFHKNGHAVIYSPELSHELGFELVRSLVLVSTGTTRYAHEMAAKVIDVIPRRAAALKEIDRIAEESVHVLATGGMEDVGTLLRETWYIKRNLHSDISSPDIDRLFERGITSGALGGKLLGAGGGGFMLFLVPMERRIYFEQNIGAPCLGFDIAPAGCRVLINEPYNVMGGA